MYNRHDFTKLLSFTGLKLVFGSWFMKNAISLNTQLQLHRSPTIVQCLLFPLPSAQNRCIVACNDRLPILQNVDASCGTTHKIGVCASGF